MSPVLHLLQLGASLKTSLRKEAKRAGQPSTYEGDKVSKEETTFVGTVSLGNDLRKGAC